MTVHKRPRVVIVGAGFGGLWAARSLAHSELEVWLIDRNNYHTFLPLLYQVAAAELEPEDIARPIRSGLRKLPNVHFVLGEVNGIDFNACLVRTSASAIAYDYLILALGSTPRYFGIQGASEHSLPLRTLAHGIAARNQILRCFERAVHEPDAEQRRRMLTFAVVGGGPTGVEFAGSLAELIKGPLKKDYPSLDFGEVCVILIEAADRLLPNLPERLARYTLSRLRKMTVDVRLRAPVSQITAGSVRLKDGDEIRSETAIWTAGMRGDPAAESWGLPTARSGQVTVRPTLQTPDHPDVYVIGDLAYIEHAGRPLPMVAPVATQQGVMAAQNIGRQIAGQSPLPFQYHDRGSMVTIGRNAAVTDLQGRCFTGFIAWLLWLSVHIFNLIGFRNRLLVLVNWAWDYFFYERAVRLILPSESAPGLPVSRVDAESRAERADK
jgi:NADH dehydrogenase